MAVSMSTRLSGPQSVPSQAVRVTPPFRQGKGSEGTAQEVAGASVEKQKGTPAFSRSWMG